MRLCVFVFLRLFVFPFVGKANNLGVRGALVCACVDTIVNFACTSSPTISVRSCNTLQQSETHCNTLTRWRRLARTQHIEALLRFPSAADRRVFSWHLVEGCFEDMYSSFADMHIPLVVWRTRRLFYKDTGLWMCTALLLIRKFLLFFGEREGSLARIWGVFGNMQGTFEDM